LAKSQYKIGAKKAMSLVLKNIFFIFIVGFVLGCQTPQGVVLSETPLPIRATRITISNAIGEARVISLNGREISTHFHDRKLKFLEITPKTQERLYTKVVILGARRPYDIAVEVHVEQRDPDSKNFHDVGVEESLSLVQAKTIQQALNQSRDRSHVIDEGSPF